ncbi:response regulator [Anaerotalea alkaliphila]|uniref:Stage 0 sporulation protein A homolog n=1 Tax=Anaerotalea alkaliphila TaxID=2662126 RepID=A0A7X5KM04_9FIRM|nr:response regulator [Anaerotalea alkaliphila]NDL67279.1 response regulator [Anaerotalea alkaliphila]
MKILIVDNEAHVIDAIRMLIDWSAFPPMEVHTARDGEQAVELVRRHKPEIILTDMKMPRMDGMALLEWLAESVPQAKVVVISGYNDFAYIQHTLRHGGLDYITKPIDEVQLNRALAKAVQAVERSRSASRLEREHQRGRELQWEQEWLVLLEDPLHHQAERRSVEARWGIQAGSPLVLGVLKVQELSGHLQRQFGNSLELLQFAARNVSQEILEKRGVKAAVFSGRGQKGRLVLVFLQEKGVEGALEEIMEALGRVFDQAFVAGLSGTGLFPQDLPRLYKEGEEALAHRNLCRREAPVARFREAVPRETPPLREHLEVWKEALREGRTEPMAGDLSALFGRWVAEGFYSERMVEELLSEYQVLRKYLVPEGACPPMPPGGLEALRSLRTRKSYGRILEAVQEALLGDLESLARCWRERREVQNPAEQVRRHLEEHYREPLTLDLLARQVHLSREHLARSYKKAFGATVMDHLLEIRLAEARNLLERTDLPVKEVAARVGFEDPKYFSKVFRKQTGMRPTDFSGGRS